MERNPIPAAPSHPARPGPTRLAARTFRTAPAGLQPIKAVTLVARKLLGPLVHIAQLLHGLHHGVLLEGNVQAGGMVSAARELGLSERVQAQAKIITKCILTSS